jgi:hypothetical protein
VYLEDLWLIPTLENLKSYLDKDKHFEELREIDKIKESWDKRWKKHKRLESPINVSDIKLSEHNLDYE